MTQINEKQEAARVLKEMEEKFIARAREHFRAEHRKVLKKRIKRKSQKLARRRNR